MTPIVRHGSAADSRGISAFAVLKDTPGFSIGKLETKMGMRGSPTGELIFQDAIVPAEQLDGGAGYTNQIQRVVVARRVLEEMRNS